MPAWAGSWQRGQGLLGASLIMPKKRPQPKAPAAPPPPCVTVWDRGATPQAGDQFTTEELLETEMLQLFARQDSWERRNVLVSQKAADFSFDVGWETITQRQDHETQSQQGQTGGVVWDAAVVLARFVFAHAKALNLPAGDSARWIELGAGCGAVGIAAAKLLSVDTVITDQAAILPILRANVQANGCAARARVSQLDWGADGATDMPPETLARPFDVVLAADCVFNEHLVDLLIAAVLRCSGPQTQVLCSMELREPSVTSAFLEAAEKAFGRCVRVDDLAAADAGGRPGPDGPDGLNCSNVVVYLLSDPLVVAGRTGGSGAESHGAAAAPEAELAGKRTIQDLLAELEMLLPLLPLEKRAPLRQMLVPMPAPDLADALRRLRKGLAAADAAAPAVCAAPSEPPPKSLAAKSARRNEVPAGPPLGAEGKRQLQMLTGFYHVNDPSKTPAAAKQILDKRRGPETELTAVAFDDLCGKLAEKYGDHPAAYDDNDL
eukprot:SAG22_NODE_113_length_19407_cov_214.925161_17_plen_493_part_00